ncbi:MAG: septum formation initiator family protein [Bacteroidaceae bacterium]|nr:septum formation initiator family protein [Bacteroidaceae bacterium]
MNDSIGRLINWVIKHKYLAVTIAFLLILVFFDENNMLKHIQSKREEAQLRADIEELQKEHDIVMRKLGELETDANMLEKVAREKYGMHLDNEEIFIIKD